MSILDRVRSVFSSPATKRLSEAEREAWASAPSPVIVGSTGGNVGPFALGGAPGKPPTIEWFRDSPPPPPESFTFKPGHSDHVYQQFAAPLGFEGWDLNRIDTAVALMRLGTFVEASNLLVAILGFAPVLAALYQAVAPMLAQQIHVRGGDKGVAREVRELVEVMFPPHDGLRPSPYFPPELRGTLAIYLRMYGFAVLQHVDGDVDRKTGVRMRYTRIWEPWATQLMRNPRKRIAWTSEGNQEILNDGKFTIICDEQEPHFTGALVALGQEAYGGKLTQAQRQNWLDFFGDPKIYATLPDKVATGSDAGAAFKTAVNTIYQPGGRGVLPYGSTMDAIAISGEGSQAFRDALIDRIIHIYMVLTGSAGTIGNGMNTGAGPQYQPAKGGAWNVRHDLIARPVLAMVRGLNQGHVAPFVDINFAEAVAGAKRAGTWADPAIEIPIVAPDRDERIEAETKRYQALVTQAKSEREAGGVVDQDRIDTLATVFEVKPFRLAASSAPAARLDLAPTDLAKVVRASEARASRGLAPFGDERDNLTIAELDAVAKSRAAGDAIDSDPNGSPPAQDAPENAPAPSDRTDAATPADVPA